MQEYLLKLYDQLTAEINRIATETTGAPLADRAFDAASRYWQQVKLHVRQNGFADTNAEIEFFKTIKPKFTALLEFYLLLFRYWLYADSAVGVREKFRQDELERIRKFRETHATFIRYYEEGRTDWDKHYSLRRKFNRVQHPPSPVYDRATDFWTNGDWIVTLYLASNRFEKFLQNPDGSPMITEEGRPTNKE
jgi:hypothetical protein